MQDPGQQLADASVLRLLLLAAATVLLAKLYLASVLDLYSDEVFYWQASTMPAPAYSDLPFMTSLLAGLGSALDPGNPFAVRLLFIVLGSALPFLLYWLALPLTGRRQALESALLGLCLPLGGFLGLLAVPDVPLIFLGLLSIGFFERALRSNGLGYWIGTGLFVALGLSTHYRFFLYPLAAILFLTLFQPARVQWRNPRLWLGFAIAAIGLTPILWFNLSYQASSASFYFVERHPWEFQAGGLLHLFKQAGLVTPPLYLVLLLTAWQLYRRAGRGDSAAALLLSFALVNLLVYLLLAPWTDATSTSIHWPLSGYFPLLVFVPGTLRAVYLWLASRRQEPVAARLTLAIPLLGFVGTLVALIGVGSQGFQQSLQPVLGSGVLSNKMAGWDAFADYTGELLQRHFPEAAPVVVTDNYYTAAQVEFAGLAAPVYTLDRDKAVRDGRITQYRLWQRDQAGLAALRERALLYINEDSTLTVPDKEELMAAMCYHSRGLRHVGELSLFNGDKRFSYYLAPSLAEPGGASDLSNGLCPYPARAWLDAPLPGDELRDTTGISGWAYNEDLGLERVYLLVDGKRFAQLNYGIARPDVVQAMEVRTDPNSPDLGLELQLDTRTLDNGEHELELELVDARGVISRYGARRVTVAN